MMEEQQQQRQGAGVFIAEEDISYFVFSCLWQEICKNLTQEPQKLPVVVAVVVPPPFHASIWGTTESVHYKTEEEFLASPFPLNMRRKYFKDGGYAELMPEVMVSYDFKRLRTKISLCYQIFNVHDTLQWPHQFNEQHLELLLQWERQWQLQHKALAFQVAELFDQAFSLQPVAKVVNKHMNAVRWKAAQA
ncbi:hypothetical protein QOT17_012848 [Balamuthia mandrillaris]